MNWWKRTSFCYNCDEQGHLARDFPLPRRPWCAHYRNNTHATEDCPDLIAKWEDRARQRGENLINYEPRVVAKGRGPNINIITRGGEKTGIDAKIPHQIKIQKVVPENTKYDLYDRRNSSRMQ
jgi:hypothetical protein